ncbi:MAG: hypothetical protein R2827_11220 [Bdellovibrionales bacterium]
MALPLLIAEMCIGKMKKPVISAFKWLAVDSTAGNTFSIGQLGGSHNDSALLVYILVYCAVISWVMHFFMQFFVGLFNEDFQSTEILSVLKERSWLQVMLASAHLLIVVGLVTRLDQGKMNGL